MYRINENGELGSLIKKEEIESLAPNTKARIVVEASDYRNVEMKGLVGIDLDITWSPNIQLENNTEKITNELPLFNTIEQRNNGMRVKAGSAPDGFNIGGMVGDIENENIISFDIILTDPQSTSSISVTPGTGSDRDGLLDRYADVLDESNSIVNSFSTNNSGLLEILSPPNNSVGTYKIILTAKDEYNKSASTTIKLNIKNTNDVPYVNSEAYTALRNFFDQNNSEISSISEGEEVILKPISLFGDDDLLHQRMFREQLNVRLIENNENTLNAFELISEPNGVIQLTINPPKGIVDFVEQRIRFEAVDSAGEKISTDWFTIMLKPIAELHNLLEV